MPTYQIRAPDGNLYRIEGPDGATDAQVAAEVMRQHPQASQPRKTVADRAAPPQSMLRTGTNALSRGATAGLDNYVAAGVTAPLTYAMHRLQGKPTTLSGEFRQDLGNLQAQDTANARANPTTNALAEFAGGVASPINRVGAGIKGANLAARVGRVAVPAAVYGATSGATSTNGSLADRAIGAGVGAASGLVGAGLGVGAGRLIGKLAPRLGEESRALVGWVTGKSAKGEYIDRAAARRVLQRVEADAKGMGPTAQDMLDLRKAMPKNKPLTLMDLGGENVRGYAGRISRAPGEGRNAITKFLVDRNKGTGQRLEKDIAEHIAKGNAYESREVLNQARKAAARPLYEQAYAHTPISPDMVAPEGAITKILQRPSGRAGMGAALKLAAEEGVDPNRLGIDFDAAGDPMLVKVPTWQTLDYIKRGMDDVVAAATKNEFGQPKITNYGRLATQSLNEFRGILKQANPHYGAALDAWSGPTANMDASFKGQHFASMRVEQIRDTLKNMTASERENFKLGIADALQDKLARNGGKIGNVNQKDYLIGKLRPVFGSQAAYDKFVNSVEAEYTMMAAKNDIIGGSPTGRRVAEDESGDELNVTKAGLHAAHGNMLRAMMHLGDALRGRANTVQNQAINAAAARLLTKPLNANSLQALAAHPPQSMQWARKALPVAGGVAGAQLFNAGGQ